MNPIQLFLFCVNYIKGNRVEACDLSRKWTIFSYFVLKMTLSLGVLLVAFVELERYMDYKDCMFLIPGLMFCTAGDVTLFLSNEYDIELKEPYFTLGIMSFGFAHVMFCADLIFLADFKFTPALLMIPVTVCGVFFLYKKGILALGQYRNSLMIYAVLVGSFCAFGINLMLVREMDRQIFFLGAGSMMFWFSDLSLSFRCFNKKVPDWFGTFVFTSYFLATYAMALSLRGY